MSESRRKKDLSAALALLVLTSSAVTTIPASADEAVSKESQQALEVLESVDTAVDSQADVDQKLEEARSLLREATKRQAPQDAARSPVCAEFSNQNRMGK